MKWNITCGDNDIITVIQMSRTRWLGYVNREKKADQVIKSEKKSNGKELDFHISDTWLTMNSLYTQKVQDGEGRK